MDLNIIKWGRACTPSGWGVYLQTASLITEGNGGYIRENVNFGWQIKMSITSIPFGLAENQGISSLLLGGNYLIYGINKISSQNESQYINCIKGCFKQ